MENTEKRVLRLLMLLMMIVFSCLASLSAYAQAVSETVLYAADAPVKVGDWSTIADSTAAGGTRLAKPDAGLAKIMTPLANPVDYFEMTFNVEAGKPYHLWLRGRAENDSPYNDSVYVQFSGTVDGSGSSIYRIGTASATSVNLEECKGCGISGWGWQDNGWGVPGSNLYFAKTGPQTIRIQTREDGLSIDQIVLSAQSYLNVPPGTICNDATILAPNAVLLKVLSWNVHKSVGTDNGTSLDRIATYIHKVKPDVVMVCELIDRSTVSPGKSLADLMRQKSGVTWYYHWLPKYPGGTEGNLILSKIPFVSKSGRYLSYERSVAQVTIKLNNRMVNIFGTHLAVESSSYRWTEANELVDFAAGFGDNRIIGGDFNASYGTNEIMLIKSSYYDTWEKAVGLKTAVAYADNPIGMSTRTRRGRIDYLFCSRNAPNLILMSAKVPDTRDLSNTNVDLLLGTLDDKGVRPSDHNQVVATFMVN